MSAPDQSPPSPSVAKVPCTLQPEHQGDCENWYAQESWPRTSHAPEPVDPPWDEVPERDCYTKTSGQSCGPAHGWGSSLNSIYRCSGTRQSDDPAPTRAEKIAAAIVPEQLDQYLPAEPSRSVARRLERSSPNEPGPYPSSAIRPDGA